MCTQRFMPMLLVFNVSAVLTHNFEPKHNVYSAQQKIENKSTFVHFLEHKIGNEDSKSA